VDKTIRDLIREESKKLSQEIERLLSKSYEKTGMYPLITVESITPSSMGIAGSEMLLGVKVDYMFEGDSRI
jgi:hypothetical protein